MPMTLLYIMNIRVLLFLSGLFTTVSCIAQEEHWDAYMSVWNGKPESIMVDMAQMPTSPNKLLPWLVITGPVFDECGGKDGIPNETIMNEMEKVLDATGNMLSGATVRKLLGTVTRNCTRLNYYYVRDTAAVRHAINRMYTNTYAGYKYELKIKQDPDWKIYRTFLYPDSATQCWMACVKQIAALGASKDVLASNQNIFYTLFFPNAAARSEFEMMVEMHGYKTQKTSVVQGITPLFEIEIARNTKISIDSILANEDRLKALARQYNGHYKGWNAPQISR